jgi:toxin ParE1/3/4
MPSSHRLLINPEAQADIRDLLQYTLETWGRAQRDKYKAHILGAMQRLREYPEIGEERDDLGKPYRRLVVEQHVIYYRIEPKVVRVIRVLHSRRDVPRNLGE